MSLKSLKGTIYLIIIFWELLMHDIIIWYHYCTMYFFVKLICSQMNIRMLLWMLYCSCHFIAYCFSYQCFLLTWLAFLHCRWKASTCQKASSCQSEGWMKAGPCSYWPIRRSWWKVRWSAVRPTPCLCSTARLQREESACSSCIIKVSVYQNKPLMR